MKTREPLRVSSSLNSEESTMDYAKLLERTIQGSSRELYQQRAAIMRRLDTMRRESKPKPSRKARKG